MLITTSLVLKTYFLCYLASLPLSEFKTACVAKLYSPSKLFSRLLKQLRSFSSERDAYTWPSACPKTTFYLWLFGV